MGISKAKLKSKNTSFGTKVGKSAKAKRKTADGKSAITGSTSSAGARSKRGSSEAPKKKKLEVKGGSRPVSAANKKKKRVYTAEELGVPKLNGIVPQGAAVRKGKGGSGKKGKTFVDDADSMMAIMGLVQAEKEGEREGKMAKARQLEEIREAKKVEMERRDAKKKEKLEKVKEEIKGKRKRKGGEKVEEEKEEGGEKRAEKKGKKRVSFG